MDEVEEELLLDCWAADLSELESKLQTVKGRLLYLYPRHSTRLMLSQILIIIFYLPKSQVPKAGLLNYVQVL